MRCEGPSAIVSHRAITGLELKPASYLRTHNTTEEKRSRLLSRVYGVHGRSLLETRYSNQFILQGRGSLWCTHLARQYGVHCLEVCLTHFAVFLAADVRRTHNDAASECLTQKLKTRIGFTYPRQVVKLRPRRRRGERARPLHLRVFTREITHQLYCFGGMRRK